VASGLQERLVLAGLVALRDPPRKDSSAVLQRLRELGLRIVMITGDGLATARAVASEVGIDGDACRADSLGKPGSEVGPDCGVIAEVYPEDKFHVVEGLQRLGHVTGMTGDGVNDAPALKQAEVGVAVANATDVAKAAASLVLTNPGLVDLPAAVETSRRVYQRMLTYTLNKVVKTFQIAVFLSLGVLLTGSFVITPLLVVLLLFLNDFVTMSVATDRVSFSVHPDRWPVRILMGTGFALALLVLAFSFGILFAARDLLHLSLPQIQTLMFVMLVFTGQGNIYLIRERGHLWSSRPSRWLMASSLGAVAIAVVLAVTGTLMTSIQPALIADLLGATVVFLLVADLVKIRLFKWFGLR
jgi:H+-transporting ATPase